VEPVHRYVSAEQCYLSTAAASSSASSELLRNSSETGLCGNNDDRLVWSEVMWDGWKRCLHN
jgi:hypothetical protein